MPKRPPATLAPLDKTDAPLPAVQAAPRLLTIDPEQYVATAFQTLDAEVTQAIKHVGKVVHDVTTPDGMEAAKADRKVFRELRWATDRHHKDVKKPVLLLTNLIDGKKHQLLDQIAPFEAHYHDPIEAEEARKAAMARAREHAELERINTLERQVAALANAPAQALGQPASIIETVLIAVQETIVDERYAEYEQMALAAKAKAITDLTAALAQARELEQLRQQVALAPVATAPVEASTPPCPHHGDVLLHCYRYLIGLDTDYHPLLADVEASLDLLGIALPSH